MAETDTPKAKKAPAAKKDAAPKAETVKVAAPRTAPAKAKAEPASKPAKAAVAAKPTAPAKAPKAAFTGPTLTVTQTGSVLGRPEWAKQTLVGLGLNKRHRTRVLQDTPSVRGMIERVKHLVRVGE